MTNWTEPGLTTTVSTVGQQGASGNCATIGKGKWGGMLRSGRTLCGL